MQFFQVVLFLVAVSAQPYYTYIPGNLPLILSSPHGGSLQPAEIETRQHGCYIGGVCDWHHNCGTPNSDKCEAILTSDAKTQNLTNEISDALFNLTGRRPFVIHNNLHRSKLDANRPKVEGAQYNATAEQAWDDFQNSIIAARGAVVAACTKGFYIDVHGQNHSEQWIEWGYSLNSTRLAQTNTVLNTYVTKTSLRNLCSYAPSNLSMLVRGATTSFGGLLESATYGSYKSVPSPTYPDPAGGNYFQGGFNTDQHGSESTNGPISGMQMEVNSNLRINDAVRIAFAQNLALVIAKFFNDQIGINLTSHACLTNFAL